VALLVIFFALIFIYSLVYSRLERTIVTAPMAFTVAGMVAYFILTELREPLDRGTFLRLAEIGLVLLLFTEASQVDLGVMRHVHALPMRLLTRGMVSTVLMGLVAAMAVFPNLSNWEAGILAAILAPTDAGLGQIIVTSKRVPEKIREALNIEAGLNDGLSVPLLLFFIALAQGAQGGHALLAEFMAKQLGLGVLIGGGIGLLGGWLLGRAQSRNWMAHSWQQLGVVALPLLAIPACEAADASMFIAAFVAGLTVQIGFKEVGRHSIEFGEEWGQMVNLSVFFLFGLLVVRIWSQFNLRHVAYAVLSLTIVRMLPVALALWGTRLSKATVLFMGWFGPRGLASIVLGLVYLEQEARLPGESTIQLAVMMTVVISIFAHGMSAVPGLGFYARTISRLPPESPEFD